jgi:DNA-directed RNA polymerase specialized sigma24 family protein
LEVTKEDNMEVGDSMSKQNKTIEYLELIAKYTKMIKNRKLDCMRLFDIATSTTAKSVSVLIDNKLHNMDKVQSSSSNQKMADAIVEKVDLENDDYGIKELIAKRQAIIREIEALNLDEYDVLYKRYVFEMEYQDIAEECNKSKSWVTSVHGRALKSLEKLRSDKNAECNSIEN